MDIPAHLKKTTFNIICICNNILYILLLFLIILKQFMVDGANIKSNIKPQIITIPHKLNIKQFVPDSP